MSIPKNLLLLASAVGLGAGLASGQAENTFVFEFSADSVANYRQSVDGTFFEGGTFEINVRDGNAVYQAGCEGPRYFPPSQPCPLGATGFVSRGLDNDPLLRGLGPYFSISSISPAKILRPFDQDSVQLVSAPPSLLPRPIAGFEDRSLSVFYDLQTAFIKQYPVTSYNLARQYSAGERNRFDGEVVPGTYKFNFGSLESETKPVNIGINIFPTLDGYRKINNVRQGFRFTNVVYDDGFAVLDPFNLNTLTWEGNTRNYINSSADQAYFSIKRLLDPSDPLSDPDLNPLVAPIFPNFLGPTTTRVLLPNPLDTSYILAPNFLLAGQTGLIDMEFVVYRPTSNQIYDRPIRRFRMPVKILNPFASAISAFLPPKSTAQQRSADFDFDGDGVSNFTEWAFGSDPANASSVPGGPAVKMVPVALSQAAKSGKVNSEPTSALEYKVAKLTNTVPRLKYSVEYTADMKTWTEIKGDDPAWNVVESRDELKVTSSSANPGSGGFFRTKVRVAP